jgi:hypothetical protein
MQSMEHDDTTLRIRHISSLTSAASKRNLKPSPRVSGEARCFRDELLDEFLRGINRCRVRDGYKPIKIGRVIGLVGRNTTSELSAFLKKCQQAENFSRCFFGSLKPRDTMNA